MTQKRTLTRREFIRLSAVGAAGAVVTACTPTATTQEVVAPTATSVPPTKPAVNINATATTGPTATAVVKFQEAPMLAELVKAGTLPPVTERLPENPLVMVPLDKVGTFGGTMRRAFNGVSDRNGPGKLQDRTWAWFDQSLAIQPRMMESWEVSDDGTEWTFFMRKGTKWSDGTPHTSADIVWYFENVLKNELLTKAPPSQWSAGKPRELAVVDPVDDFTVKFTFVAPKPMFIYYVTRGAPAQPGHYLQKFHAELTDDKAALEKEATDKGFPSWDAYYLNDRTIWQLNPDLPTLGAWNGKNALSTEQFLMERNPYFYAVDPDGNQLPYIDKITHRLFENADVLNLWVVGGEIDFQYRHMSFGNYTLYKESEEQGDYKAVLGINASHLAIQPNHTTKNEKLREFFQTRDVRIAMSLAMNRQEINDLIWDGMLTPRQYSPLALSPQYYEKATTAYIEYDPDKANELLDAAGYDKKDANGIRLYKDGTPISFTIEGTATTGTPDDDTIQLAVKYLQEVGIQAAYKGVERSLYTEHYNSNEIEAAFWGGDRTVLPLVPEAIIFRGTQPDRPWCPAYAHWYNNGPSDPNAIEPPADSFVKKIWDIWDQITVTVDPEEQNKLFFQILDIWAEEVPMIGLLGEMPAVCIVKNGWLNFKEGFPADDTTGDENVYNTETYSWDDPSKHTA